MLRIGDRNVVVIPLTEWQRASSTARIGNENIILTVPDGTTAAEMMALAEKIPAALAAAKAAAAPPGSAPTGAPPG